MKLWLDVGNTRVKWQITDKGAVCHSGSVVHQSDFSSLVQKLVSSFEQKVDIKDIELAGFSSVLNAANDSLIRKAWAQFSSCELIKPKVTRDLANVTCAYDELERLGLDRWLAIVAAFNRYKSAVCVVDCGSALTIDVVNKAGQHGGGYIIPGLRMAAQALTGDTDSVRFDDGQDQSSLAWGSSTKKAVLNGVLASAVGVVQLALEAMRKDDQSVKLVLTGGDARMIAEQIQESHVVVDDLVLEGLRIALQ